MRNDNFLLRFFSVMLGHLILFFFAIEQISFVECKKKAAQIANKRARRSFVDLGRFPDLKGAFTPQKRSRIQLINIFYSKSLWFVNYFMKNQLNDLS